jgi:O-antigen/teichoic acid export membrane protein
MTNPGAKGPQPASGRAAPTAWAAGVVRSWLGILGYQALGFLVMAATSMVAVVAVPPRIWGEYWLLLSAVQVISGVTLSWVGQSTLLFARKEQRASGDIRSTLASALALQAAIWVIVVIAGMAVRKLPWISQHVTPSISALLVLSIGLLAAYETVSYALQAQHRFDGLGKGAAMSKLGPLLAVAAIWSGAPSSAGLLLAGLAAGYAAALLVTVLALPARSGGRSRPSWSAIRDVISYGSRLPIASAATLASTWLHVWFVRSFSGAAEAGVYAWAASLQMLVSAMLIPLATVLSPQLTDIVLDERKAHASRAIHTILALGVLAAALAPLALATMRVAATILPERYAAAGPILIVMLAGSPAQIMALLTAPMVRAVPALMNGFVKRALAVAASNLLLNAVLTPLLGAAGAALSLALTFWIACALQSRQATAAFTIGPTPLGAPPRVILLAGAVVIPIALLLSALPPGVSFAAGLASTFILIVAARQANLLAPLAGLPRELDFPQYTFQTTLTRLFHWCQRR